MTNIPEIRFKGFTDAWVQRKLGEVADIFDGTHQTPRYTNEGVMFLSVENINSLQSDKYISVDDFETEFKNFPVYGDVLMTRIGDIGTANVVRTNKNIAYYVSLALLKPKNADSDFLVTAISSEGMQAEIWQRTLHVAFPKKINLGEIFKLEMSVPTLPEQTAVGSFFRTLDDTITLHQRKLDGLKKMKAGYLQQMFPRTGENVTRVRFAGFTGEWKTQKLGDMVEKLKSYPLSRDVETENNTGYRYIHYGDIHKQRADIITNDEQLPKIKASDYSSLQRGDIIVADASEDYIGIAEPCVIVHKPTEKIIAGLHTIAMRPKETDSIYLYYLLHTEHFKKFGNETGTGLKVFGITFINMAKYETSHPSALAEQIAIGSFFLNLDEQISNQTKKIERLKQLKSAYLQKMFI